MSRDISRGTSRDTGRVKSRDRGRWVLPVRPLAWQKVQTVKLLLICQLNPDLTYAATLQPFNMLNP
jgi:hypothetical protein